MGLKVALFGRFRVVQDAPQIEGFDGQKVRELLSYLFVFRDRPHARAYLAESLWGDQPPEKSKKNLRQTQGTADQLARFQVWRRKRITSREIRQGRCPPASRSPATFLWAYRRDDSEKRYIALSLIVPDYAAACCMTNKFKAESCESLEVLAILETGQPPRAVIPRSRWAGRLPPMLYLNQGKFFRTFLITPEGWFTPAAQKRSPSSDLTGGAAK